MSQAQITISAANLPDLPSGASFNKKSGRAQAEVSRDGDSIIVTATCDSLEREIEYYESLYYKALEAMDRLKNSVQNRDDRRSTSTVAVFASVLTGLFVGMISTIIIITLYQRRKTK